MARGTATGWVGALSGPWREAGRPDVLVGYYRAHCRRIRARSALITVAGLTHGVLFAWWSAALPMLAMVVVEMSARSVARRAAALHPDEDPARRLRWIAVAQEGLYAVAAGSAAVLTWLKPIDGASVLGFVVMLCAVFDASFLLGRSRLLSAVRIAVYGLMLVALFAVSLTVTGASDRVVNEIVAAVIVAYCVFMLLVNLHIKGRRERRITAELRSAMADLQERERARERLALVAEHTTDAVIITDAEHRIEWVNPAFVERTGLARADVLGRTRRAAILPDDPDPAALAEFDAGLAAGVPVRREVRVGTREGAPTWHDMSLTPIRGEDGAIARWIAVLRDVSEAKAREEELERVGRQLARLSLAAEHARDSIVLTDAEGLVEWVNGGFLAATGLPAAEIMGRPRRSLADPDNDPAVFAAIDAAVAAREPIVTQLRLLRAGGRWIWHEVSLTPILDGRGALRNYISVERDISELKAREEELTETSRSLRKLVLAADHASDAIVVTDPDLRIEWANRAFAERLSLGLDEMVGRTRADVEWPGGKAPPGEDSEARARVRRACAAGRPVRERLAMRRHDGARVWHDVTATPVRDERGAITHWIGVERDVSELRAREAELADKERELSLLALVAEHARDGVVVYDPDGMIVWANDSFVVMTDRPLEEIVGRRVGSFMVEASGGTSAAERVRAAMAAREHVRVETRLMRADGGMIWADIDVSPVWDEHGEIVRFISVERDITELKAREAELERKERERARLALVAEHATDSVVVTDARDHIEWVNEAFTDRTGWRLEDVAGRPSRLMAYPDEDPETLAALNAAIDARRPFRGQLRVWCRGDRWVWYDVSLTPLLDAEGRFEKYISVERDISELKAREAELAEKERERSRLALVAEHARDGVAIYDRKARFEWVNAGYEAQTGRRAEDLVGLPGITFALEGQDEELGRLTAAVRAGRPTRVALQMRRGDGGAFWCDADVTPVFDDRGELIRWVSVERDVTEAKVREAELAEKERERARLALVAEHARDGVAIYTPEGVVEWVNPGLVAMSGFEPGELIGRDVGMMVDDDADEREARERVRAAMASRGPTRITARMRRKGGGRYWCDADFLPVLGPDGQIAHWISVERDVTEAKAREAELGEARAVAEAAAEAKSRFLATMSHEIRTPMNGILGTADLLAESGLDEEQSRLVRTITLSSEALLRIINDVLDLSKLEADRVELDPQPFDPAELAETCAQLLRPLAERKGLALHVALPGGGAPTLDGDGGRIQQVVLNLLGNAIKFTEGGSVTLSLGLDADGAGSRRLTMDVADTGIGIAPDRLEAVFDDFSQADGTITRRFGGTGLGLSISRKLAEAMGGALSATSTPGVGSTFTLTLTLPVVEPAAAAEPEAARRAAPHAAGARARGGAPLVLLVDDNATNLFLAEKMLAGCGVRVATARDGAEAVAAFEDLAPDLVLMDVSMPVMDGFEATRRVRALEAARGAARCPLMLLTAHAGPEHREEGLAAGVDGFLAKPVRKAEIAAVVADQLGGADEFGGATVAPPAPGLLPVPAAPAAGLSGGAPGG